MTENTISGCLLQNFKFNSMLLAISFAKLLPNLLAIYVIKYIYIYIYILKKNCHDDMHTYLLNTLLDV